MKIKFSKSYIQWGVTALAVITGAVLLFFCVYRFDFIADKISGFTAALTGVITGAVMAYLLNPVMNFFEQVFSSLFERLNKRRGKIGRNIKKPVRILSLFMTISITLVAISLLVSAIIPEILNAIKHIIEQMPSYLNSLSNWGIGKTKSLPFIENAIYDKLVEFRNGLNDGTYYFDSQIALNWLNDYKDDIFNLFFGSANSAASGAGSAVSSAFDIALKVIGILINSLVGFIVCIYLLYGKEKFAAQAKKISYATMTTKQANGFLRNIRELHRIFGGFLTGKIIDSVIIGIITFVLMKIFDLSQYTVLISVFVGVTNVIPYFGPFIGAIPSILLILAEDPQKSLYFAVLILAIQQFDGNILGPKILGESTGLSSFWIIFSIMAGSHIFGILGFIVGIPIFAVIYAFAKEYSEDKLKKKGLPPETAYYDDIAYIYGLSPEIASETGKSFDVIYIEAMLKAEKLVKKETKLLRRMRKKKTKDESETTIANEKTEE